MGGMDRDLGRGLYLYTVSARFNHAAASGHVSREPYLWFAASLPGGGTFDHGGKLRDEVSPGTAYCSLLAPDNESVVSYASGRHSAGGFAITRDRLARLVEGQEVAGPVGAFLKGQFDPTFARFTCTARMQAVLAQISNHPYHGAMETIFLEAKAYELLAENLRLLADPHEKNGMSASRKRALAAREFMMADLAHPPAIGEVARQVGLSQRALTHLFHEIYGASPLKCLNTWRLEAAQALLGSGEHSVKQVAYLLGYSQPSNFSQAFFRQFGLWPTDFQSR